MVIVFTEGSSLQRGDTIMNVNASRLLHSYPPCHVALNDFIELCSPHILKFSVCYVAHGDSIRLRFLV